MPAADHAAGKTRLDPIARVIDHGQQHHRLATTLGPVVQRSVHLHQFAEAGPPGPAPPVNFPLTPPLPQPLRHQPTPQRLRIHLQVQLGQLLTRQRRTKITEMLPILRQHRLTQVLGQPPIRGPTTQTVHDRPIAFDFQASLNPPHLPLRQTQQARRFRLRPLALQHPLHDLQNIPLTLTHLHPV
jgi:hypothetical protein